MPPKYMIVLYLYSHDLLVCSYAFLLQWPWLLLFSPAGLPSKDLRNVLVWLWHPFLIYRVHTWWTLACKSSEVRVCGLFKCLISWRHLPWIANKDTFIDELEIKGLYVNCVCDECMAMLGSSFSTEWGISQSSEWAEQRPMRDVHVQSMEPVNVSGFVGREIMVADEIKVTHQMTLK